MVVIVGIPVMVGWWVIAAIFLVADVFPFTGKGGSEVWVRPLAIAHKHPARAESQHREKRDHAEQAGKSRDEVVRTHKGLGCPRSGFIQGNLRMSEVLQLE